MNRTELRERLTEAGISDDAFQLSGGFADEKYVLEQSDSGWSVYYSERGERSSEQVYETEDEACEGLLNLLIKDPTARERRIRD